MLHVIQRAVTDGDVLGEQAAEGGVIEMERFAMAPVSGGREGIFPGAAEEVGQGAQVKNGLGMSLIRVMGEAVDQGSEDGDVDWPHSSGCRVFINPGLEKGLELEDIVGAIQPGIQEAQSGELLPHGM